jgi:hypothetical protein
MKESDSFFTGNGKIVVVIVDVFHVCDRILQYAVSDSNFASIVRETSIYTKLNTHAAAGLF